MRVAGYPAVTLGDMSTRINTEKIIGTVALPDTVEVPVAIQEMIEQFVEGSNSDPVFKTSLHPGISQLGRKPAQPFGVQGKSHFSGALKTTGERGVDLKAPDPELIDKI